MSSMQSNLLRQPLNFELDSFPPPRSGVSSNGTDKLTGFHATFSSGGVGSNIQGKRYRCVAFGGCQAKRSHKSPLRTAARTCNMRCAPLSVSLTLLVR